jgi:hypothetical protein
MGGAVPDEARRASARLDTILAVGFTVFALAYAEAFLFGGSQLYEDAAMLLRYSRHLADGHGVVWNIGESPLDGATDVLFMCLVALAHKAGVSIETAARGIGLLAHGATVALVFEVTRRRGAAMWMSCASAMYIAIGPAKAYIAAGFGTTLFAAIGAAVWALALSSSDEPTTRRAVAFGLGIIFLGIVRPEGVLFGGLMALGVAVYLGARRASPALRPFLSTTLLAGGAYFALRWWYFGDPLPNPYYKKARSTSSQTS